MNDGHLFYDPEHTGRCQKITGIGHFIESIPTKCWRTADDHDREAVRLIVGAHLKETTHRHLRSVQNESTAALEDALARYVAAIREGQA